MSHIDPGYEGHLTVRVVNLWDKTYELTQGTPLLVVRFYDLDQPATAPRRRT